MNLKKPSRSAVEICVVLGVLAFLGNYLHVTDFGIYEDDYPLTMPGFLHTWRETWQLMGWDLRLWPLGRPVGYALNHLVSWATGRFDSLTPGYLLSFALQWTNAILLFALTARLVPAPVALVAAAVLALYPAANAKQVLQGRVFNDLNMTFLLAALHLYVRGRRLAAYATAAVTLLIYEFFYLPFVVAPLLVTAQCPIRWRRVVSHGVACSAMAAGILVVRRLLGESRAAEVLSSPGATLARIGKACVIGPWTSLSALVRRTLEGLVHATGAEVFAVALVAAGMFLFLSRLLEHSDGDDAEPSPVAPLALAGALGLVVPYAVAFRTGYYPPIVTVGRLSGYHSAGAVGASLLVAAGLTFALEHLRPRRRAAWALASALIVAGLVSFGIEVQRRDYVESWRQQRELWSTVLSTSGEWRTAPMLVVDLDSGDVRERETPGFGQSWIPYAAQFGARQFVELPPERARVADSLSWKSPPAVVAFSRSLGAQPAEGGVRILTPGGADASPVIRDGEFILFRFGQGGRLMRVDEPFDTGAGVVRPAAAPKVPPPRLPSTRLYRALSFTPSLWPSVVGVPAYPP